MRNSLREILVGEGLATAVSDIPLEKILDSAEECGYGSGLRLVVGQYKSAAKLRQIVSGENFGKESIDRFLAFASASARLADECKYRPVVALLLHNAASALSKVNGNLPPLQKYLNKFALLVLEDIPEHTRDDDWWVVYEKVYVGLVESGHVDFDEQAYLRVAESMFNNHSKDAAGRADFLAHKLEEQGRMEEAIATLERVEGYTFSPQNQQQQAMATLHNFRDERYMAVPVRNVGTTREHRAEADSTSDESSGDDSETHSFIRRRDRYNTARGMFFICTRGENPYAAAPTGSVYLKNASVVWCFFVCLFY